MIPLLQKGRAFAIGSFILLRSSVREMTSSVASIGKHVVSVEEALEHQDDAVFVDGSWFLTGRNGREEFEAGPRIKGAKFFDIDDIAAPKGSEANPKALPHMMPSKELFAAAMDGMDITNDSNIILYGSQGCLFLDRAWFQIRFMGHERISIMMGSLEDWKNAGGPIEEGPTKAISASELDLSKPSRYQATDPQQTVTMEELLKIVLDEEDDSIIVDVRAKDRFLGQVDEPRPGLRLGHMPGAINLPFLDVLNPDNVSQFKSPEEIKAILKEVGVDDINTDRKIITTCGSGATACVLTAALQYCGRDPSKTFVYDGSWIEWGDANAGTPVEK